MEAIRIVLHQNSANYRKEETIDNKMTYPLPPISTVIGAIHKACGYKEYHPMKVSIQGKYESMHREPYTDYCFLNSTMDDRGILVHMRNETMLSRSYDKVASAKKSQGNSFRNNVTIDIHNQSLLKEFWRLKDLNDEILDFKKKRFQPLMAHIKIRKATLARLKKELDKHSKRYSSVCQREEELKRLEKHFKERLTSYEDEFYAKPIARFRSLTTSLKFYEVLDGITLILHIQADKETLTDIEDNIFNLTSIGRSEDFIQLEEIERVELQEELSGEELVSEYSGYIDVQLIRNNCVFTNGKDSRSIMGTKYTLNKNYTVIDNKRIFDKKKVLYVSGHFIEEVHPEMDLFVDGNYIVNLL